MLAPGFQRDGVMPVVEWRRVLSAFANLLTQERHAGAGPSDQALQAFRAVIDAVPLAVMTLAPDGKVGLWSRGAERIFGWRRSEVEGREPPYLAPEQAPHEQSLRQRVLAGNEIRNQPAQRRNSAGEVRDLVVNATPQRGADGTITGIIAVLEDVTDRRRVETSRDEHRAHLAAVLNAVADPIITIGEGGLITSVSRAAEQLFGYAAAEMVGRNVSILVPEPSLAERDTAARTGSRRVTARRKDGSTFPAEITISEAWLEGERVLAGTVRDLSGKPPAGAHAPAPPADRGDAKFLSRIVHDLRQPLHALGLMTGALERRVTDAVTRDLVNDLSAIVRQFEGTFENVVDWTRIENGQVAAVPAAFPAGEILAAVAGELAGEAQRRGLSLRCVASTAEIRCDPAVLRRTLRQLLDNALKFTPAGKVLLGARRRGATLRLIVADTGVGIPADQQEVIFREYIQLDAGREAGGLGLGLAIVRRLTELSGLPIGLSSAPGKGSMFWVDVPRADAKTGA